jgi:hypothetical protein
MFPNGNIVLERSKFNENVPAWELLAARGFGARKFPTGHIAAKGKAAKTKCARSGTHRRSYFGAAAVFRKHVCLLI